MGAKIDSFLNSFNDALLKAIDANAEKKANFDKVRADAIKISINRSGNWPNKSSVVTIGDLFGYVFPAGGGIKNEPSAIKYNSPDPEYLTYLEDVNNFKKIYADLKKYYTFGERSNSLKEKGGAQLWFDYFMYFSYRLFLKNDSFLKKIKEANENSSSEYYQLMPNGGSSVNYYNTFDLFDSLIFGDSNINDSNGLNKFLTGNLSTDELLYEAFIEAGDSYEGPYTKDIKDPVNFINFLDGNVPKSVPDVAPPPPSILFVVATPSTIAATPSPKIPLVVYDIPNDFTIQAKTDMPLFSIYVGDQTKKIYDDYNDLPELDSEYSEDVFKGFEELTVTPDSFVNQTDDEPIGDIYTDVDKSEIGTPPKPGSKILQKIGSNYFLFNGSKGLAGHRLINVLKDLQTYLNANGFPGAVIGNNGIMRDLKASTYPNSPARAVASLHGAGLAIDVTFKIPGKSWEGIGDNGKLASDSKLTKVISSWVAGQKDLTWGAQWGGSNPSSGTVKGRGITEYHHFEIKANLISDYWKPFEKELSDMGFDIKKLNVTGKGGEIYRLNKVLLNSVGIA